MSSADATSGPAPPAPFAGPGASGGPAPAGVVQCACGARLRAPAPGARGRCPRCKREIRGPEVGERSGDGSFQSAVRAAFCPTCQTPLAEGEAAHTCPGCGQMHHRDCWNEIGGCSTYGCEHVPGAASSAEAQPPSQPLSAWGDTKICPACGERIKSIAVKCRYCDTMFDTVDPLTADELRRLADRQQKAGAVRVSAIVLFAFSLIGILAPLMAIIAAIWVPMNRRNLAAAGPVYLVLAIAAVGLSVLYSFLMLLFLLVEVL